MYLCLFLIWFEGRKFITNNHTVQCHPQKIKFIIIIFLVDFPCISFIHILL